MYSRKLRYGKNMRAAMHTARLSDSLRRARRLAHFSDKRLQVEYRFARHITPVICMSYGELSDTFNTCRKNDYHKSHSMEWYRIFAMTVVLVSCYRYFTYVQIFTSEKYYFFFFLTILGRKQIRNVCREGIIIDALVPATDKIVYDQPH